MNTRAVLRRALVSVALGTLAPLVIAQVGSGGGSGGRGPHGDNPQSQACRKQADDKQLRRGPERKAFMEKCLAASRDRGDASKSGELQEKMREGQSGHLHSDPPPPPPPVPRGS